MNRKQLILLIAALAVFGGAWLVLHNREKESWESGGARLGQKLLPNFPVNDVAAIHIKGDSEVNLVRKDDKWRVAERGNYPANFSQISDLLIKLEDLKIAQSEPIGSSQLARMQLADPGAGEGAGTLVEFKDTSGKVLQSLLLGKKHTRKSERAMPAQFGGEMPDGRYVLLKSDPKELITVSDPLNSVDAKAANWLAKDFFKVEKPSSVTFVSTNAADSWSVSRTSETAPWVLADAKAGEILDSNKVSSLSTSLNYASFVDVAADNAPAKTGLDHPSVVTIKTFDHFTYVLNIGAKTPENGYNVTVNVTADLAKERAPGKDEKPEDKAKLDKEFQDKLKPQQDKLKEESALAGTTFIVNNWLIDPLIRDRAKLMVEKETKKEPAKDGDATTPPAAEEKSDAKPEDILTPPEPAK